MEITILEESKNKIRFKLIGEDHTLCNALRKELWKDKHVTVAGYNVEHPMVSEPVMVVETSGEDPRKALFRAVEGLKSNNKEIITQLKNIK